MTYSDAVAKRLERALHLEPQLIGAEEDDEGREYLQYSVPSQSGENPPYVVDIRPGTMAARCTCEDFEHRGALLSAGGKKYRVCKHVLAVLRERGLVSEEPQMWFDYVQSQAQAALAGQATDEEENEQDIRDGEYWLDKFTPELIDLAEAMVNTRYLGIVGIEERRADAIIEMVEACHTWNPTYKGKVKDTIGHLLYYIGCQLAGRIRKKAIGAQRIAATEISPQVLLPRGVKDSLLNTMDYLAEADSYERGTFRRLEDRVILTTEEVAEELLDDEGVEEALVEYFGLKADESGEVPRHILLPCLQYLLKEADMSDAKAEHFVESLERQPFVRSDEVHEVTITRTKADGTITEEHLSAAVVAKQIVEASGGLTSIWVRDQDEWREHRVEEGLDDYIKELNAREIPPLDNRYVEALMRYTYWAALRAQEHEAQMGLPRLQHPAGHYYLYNISSNDVPEDVAVIYIGRGNGGAGNMLNTKIGKRGWLGNPYPISSGTSREESVAAFAKDFTNRLRTDEQFAKAINELRNKIADGDAVLMCHCAPLPCHGDAILSAMFPEYTEFLEHRNDAPRRAPVDIGVLIGALNQMQHERKGVYGVLADGIEYAFSTIPPNQREAALVELVGLLDQYGVGVEVSWDPDDQDVELIRLVLGPLAKALDVELDHLEAKASAGELRRKVLSWVDNLVSDYDYVMYPSQATAVKAAIRGANTREIKAMYRASFGSKPTEKQDAIRKQIEDRVQAAAEEMAAIQINEDEYLGYY